MYDMIETVKYRCDGCNGYPCELTSVELIDGHTVDMGCPYDEPNCNWNVVDRYDKRERK